MYKLILCVTEMHQKSKIEQLFKKSQLTYANIED